MKRLTVGDIYLLIGTRLDVAIQIQDMEGYIIYNELDVPETGKNHAFKLLQYTDYLPCKIEWLRAGRKRFNQTVLILYIEV